MDYRQSLNDEGYVDLADLDRITVQDWSGTGQGSHVEYEHDDIVPLEQGRFLGRGVMGDVHETTIQKWKVAHKRILTKRNIGKVDKNEIAILKKLSSHKHVIQLIGTYTHRQFLGILLYPVAVCDLHTFFDDVEAWTMLTSEAGKSTAPPGAMDPVQRDRLTALRYDFPGRGARYRAGPIYAMIGCLISAIAYLHDHKIRHKDLKPSNILLSRDRLWLSDFGSATDFSLLSQSATDSERGTPRYFSPEVAAWQPNGRAADMFSLGCILLEILTLHDRGTLAHIRENRSRDPCFHANLDRVEVWCSTSQSSITPRRHYISQEIKTMLMKNPDARPDAHQLLARVAGYDIAHTKQSKHSIFGPCCRRVLFTSEEVVLREKDLAAKSETLLQQANDQIMSLQTQLEETRNTIQNFIKANKDSRNYHKKSLEIADKETEMLRTERDKMQLRYENIRQRCIHVEGVNAHLCKKLEQQQREELLPEQPGFFSSGNVPQCPNCVSGWHGVELCLTCLILMKLDHNGSSEASQSSATAVPLDAVTSAERGSDRQDHHVAHTSPSHEGIGRDVHQLPDDNETIVMERKEGLKHADSGTSPQKKKFPVSRKKGWWNLNLLVPRWNEERDTKSGEKSESSEEHHTQNNQVPRLNLRIEGGDHTSIDIGKPIRTPTEIMRDRMIRERLRSPPAESSGADQHNF